MGMFSKSFRTAVTTSIGSFAQPSERLVSLFSGGRWGSTSSGKVVNPKTAMGLTPVYAAVTYRAKIFASVPISIFKRDKSGKHTEAVDHALWPLLNFAPQTDFDSFWWRYMQSVNLDLRGNALAFIYREGGLIKELIMLDPRNVVPVFDEKQNLSYIYYNPATGREIPLRRDMVLHVRGGVSEYGFWGCSPIFTAAEAVGGMLGLEEYSQTIFKNGARLGGVLQHPMKISTERAKQLEDKFNAQYSGSENAHKTAILEEGMKFTPLSMTLEEAQAIEMKKFNVQEVARLFGVKAHKLGDTSNMSFASTEQESLDNIIDCIQPEAKRWESALNYQLLSEGERKKYCIKINLAGLTAADMETRFASYNSARIGGWMNGDEIRQLEGLGPMPNGLGQLYLQPSGTTVLGEEPEAPPAPSPQPAEEPKEDHPSEDKPPAEEPKESDDRSFEPFESIYLPRIKLAFKRQFSDKLEVICAKEIVGINKIGDDKLDDFYIRHIKFVQDALLPELLGFCEAVCGADPAHERSMRTVAEWYSRLHSKTSRDDLRRTKDREELAKYWKDERTMLAASTLIDHILGKLGVQDA